MRDFWDARAAEDAFYFVDNRLDYGDPDYDRFWASGRKDLDVILDAVGLQIASDDRIVEIGCGVGRITRELANRAASVRAIDVSAAMIELAKEHNAELANVEWVIGDGASLSPIEEGSATGCFSHVVFQHIPEEAVTLAYIREMGRVLRTGGWAAFQISNAPELHVQRPFGIRVRQRLKAAGGRAPRGQGHPAWLGSSVSLEKLREAAASADLRAERIVGEGTQFCYVLLRKGEARSAIDTHAS